MFGQLAVFPGVDVFSALAMIVQHGPRGRLEYLDVIFINTMLNKSTSSEPIAT
jgi:hypothetical protein